MHTRIADSVTARFSYGTNFTHELLREEICRILIGILATEPVCQVHANPSIPHSHPIEQSAAHEELI